MSAVVQAAAGADCYSCVLVSRLWLARLVDFDGDQFLGKEDLAQVINAITRNAMTADEVCYICDKVHWHIYVIGWLRARLGYFQKVQMNK